MKLKFISKRKKLVCYSVVIAIVFFLSFPSIFKYVVMPTLAKQNVLRPLGYSDEMADCLISKTQEITTYSDYFYSLYFGRPIDKIAKNSKELSKKFEQECKKSLGISDY